MGAISRRYLGIDCLVITKSVAAHKNTVLLNEIRLVFIFILQSANSAKSIEGNNFVKIIFACLVITLNFTRKFIYSVNKNVC